MTPRIRNAIRRVRVRTFGVQSSKATIIRYAIGAEIVTIIGNRSFKPSQTSGQQGTLALLFSHSIHEGPPTRNRDLRRGCMTGYAEPAMRLCGSYQLSNRRLPVQMDVDENMTSGLSLAKIGNASRTMRKDGEVLERGVFVLADKPSVTCSRGRFTTC